MTEFFIVILIKRTFFLFTMTLKIMMDTKQREKYLQMMLALDGLNLEENSSGAYTPISLTNTPDELKPVLKNRQELLKSALREANIDSYDPATNKKYNPDSSREAPYTEIYQVDTMRVAANRYFVGHLLTPSTGQGNEAEKARVLNRVSVMFLDNNIGVSRMMPFRTIYLGYDCFDDVVGEAQQVFELLNEYDPGLGFNSDVPVLAGFPKNGGQPVDLEQKVYKEFPHLQFHYNKDTPILKLRAENPELFYELRNTA